MGSERHFNQASFPPFLNTYSSSIHPLFGNVCPRWQQEPRVHLTHLQPYAGAGAQSSLWCACPHTWWLSRHGDMTQCCAWWAPHVPFLNSLPSWAMAICPCRNRLASEGATHDVPALAAPEHPLLCIRKLQVMRWQEFITPDWFRPMEDFPVLNNCQWMTRREDFLAFSCQTSTQAHFFGYIAIVWGHSRSFIPWKMSAYAVQDWINPWETGWKRPTSF